MNVRVRVRLFAGLREAAGWGEEELTVAEGTTVGALRALLEATHDGLQLSGRAVYVAINQEYSDDSTWLSEGDEIAFFPPVSGGRQESRA